MFLRHPATNDVFLTGFGERRVDAIQWYQAASLLVGTYEYKYICIRVRICHFSKVTSI